MAVLRALCITVMLHLVSSQDPAADTIDIQVKNENKPSYYMDEPLGFECSYKFGTDFASQPTMSFGISYKVDADAERQLVTCGISKVPGGGVQVLPPSNTENLVVDPISKETCRSVYAAIVAGNTGTLRMSFPLKAAGLYSCYAFNTVLVEVSSDAINIEDPKTAPESPVTPSIVGEKWYVEGEEVSFSCESSGGNPASVFNYTKFDEVMGTDPIVFTAERTAEPIELACMDIVHSDYKGGKTSLTHASAKVNVYYFDLQTAEKSKQLNPGKDRDLSYELQCVVEDNLPSDAVITFAWKKDGASLTENSSVLAIQYNKEENTTNEVYTCEVTTTFKDFKPLTMTFNVEWTVDVSTIPPPVAETTSTTAKPGSGKGKPGESNDKDGDNTVTIVVIVVVVLVVIIVIVVIVVIVIKKKRNSGSAETSAAKDSRTPKGDDVEKAGDKQDEATDKEKQQLLLQQEQDNKTPAGQ